MRELENFTVTYLKDTGGRKGFARVIADVRLDARQTRFVFECVADIVKSAWTASVFQGCLYEVSALRLSGIRVTLRSLEDGPTSDARDFVETGRMLIREAFERE